MRGSQNGKLLKRTVDRWPIVPNSYVNNDGKPNLNNSDADNDNDVRLAERYKGGNLVHAFEPAANHAACFAQTCLDFQNICFICKVKLKYCPQMQGSHLGKSIGLKQVTCFHRFGGVFG